MSAIMSARPRILVVDDEMGVRESLRAILQSDCEVVTASTGDEALDIVARAPVDIMTLDLKMPGLGGQNTLALIREADPRLPVVTTTTEWTAPRLEAPAWMVPDRVAAPPPRSMPLFLLHATLLI